MRSVKMFVRRGTHHVNMSARCMSQTITQNNASLVQRTWRLPQNDQDTERFLMKWTNVQGDTFLMDMREKCIKYGIKNLSDKQKDIIKRIICNQKTKLKITLYPGVLPIDPIMKELLLLTEDQWNEAASGDPQKTDSLKDMKDKLCANGCLTAKQLGYAGSLLYQLFPKD